MRNRTKPKSDIRGKGWTYLLLTAVLVITSGLSILFIYNFFGDGGAFISFEFLTPPLLAGIGALLLVYFAFDSLRFYFVLRTLGIKLPLWYVIKLSFINVFVSTITPFATGGGFVQIYFLVKEGVPLGSATAAATLRTLLAMAFFIVAAPIILIVNPSLLAVLEGGYAWILLITISIYCMIAFLLFRVISNERGVRRAAFRVLFFLRRKNWMSERRMRKLCLTVSHEVRRFNGGLRLFVRGSKKYMCLSLFCTASFLFALFSFSVLLIGAMGYDVGPALIYQMQILINVIMYFALTPGASGIAEGGFALMVSGHVGKSDISSLTLLWRFLTVYAGTVIGMAAFYWELYCVTRKQKEHKHG